MNTVEEALTWVDRITRDMPRGAPYMPEYVLAAEVRRLRAMLEPTPDARELADRVFEAVALRVDQFFKAKNIQGGVSCGDDLFSIMDKTVLARAIESYARKDHARLLDEAAERGVNFVFSNRWCEDAIALRAAITGAAHE